MPLFTRQITGLVDDAHYASFQKELLENPKKGDVMSHSGGLRKARMRLPGRGKSGGARVIYLHLETPTAIIVFLMFIRSQRVKICRWDNWHDSAPQSL